MNPLNQPSCKICQIPIEEPAYWPCTCTLYFHFNCFRNYVIATENRRCMSCHEIYGEDILKQVERTWSEFFKYHGYVFLLISIATCIMLGSNTTIVWCPVGEFVRLILSVVHVFNIFHIVRRHGNLSHILFNDKVELIIETLLYNGVLQFYGSVVLFIAQHLLPLGDNLKCISLYSSATYFIGIIVSMFI